MKTIARRISRLEDQYGSANKPRPRLRLLVMGLGSKLCLADATCTRTLGPDGVLMESVHFQNHREGPDHLSEEEIDRWADTFPVQTH
jgi:hypothetical protein